MGNWAPPGICLCYGRWGSLSILLFNGTGQRCGTSMGYPCAAGFAAGEACSGLVQAGLIINGDTVGSQIGVPFT